MRAIQNLLPHCNPRHLNQIHGLLITSSLASHSPLLPALLLRRATEFGRMDYAHRLFLAASDFDHTLPFNVMIRGYAFNGPFVHALHLFDEMLHRSLKPNNFTYPYVLDSCARLEWFGFGRVVHGLLLKDGFDSVPSVGYSLFNFYAGVGRSRGELGLLVDARRVFDGMEVKEIGLWNRMLSEYVGFGDMASARELFDEMPGRDVVSWNSMLSGFVREMDVNKVWNFFGRMPVKNVVSWTLVVRALANVGDLRGARSVFDEMPERSVVSWNCMLSGYTKHEKFQEAFELFLQMLSEGVVPDGFTFVSALSACAHLGALDMGKWIHFNIIKDVHQIGAIVGTALAEMYAKCGDIDRALMVFTKMTEKDVFSWNVMIKAFAVHGRIHDSLKLFDLMKRRGLQPNDLTFMGVLLACAHGGLVHEGHRIFYSMHKDYNILPRIEHYGCLIDLLCRSGQLEAAQDVIKEMPYKPDAAIWATLLGATGIRNDLVSAKNTMEKITDLSTDEGGVYALFSNIYATSGEHDEALRARENMEQKKILKTTGISCLI